MSKLKILISIIAVMLVSPSTADERLVEADGTAMNTAEMPNHVFEARAIANALQSVVDTGAQYLDSFSLVENGQVLFDQVSTQSNIKIAGYRVVSTKDHGKKISVRLQVLLLPLGGDANAPTCRQPSDLGIALAWHGISVRKSLPYWMQIDGKSILRQVTAQVNSDGKFKVSPGPSTNSLDESSYSLYEKSSDVQSSNTNPKYTASLKLELDIINNSNLLAKSKTLIIKVKSDLSRKTQLINSTELEADIEFDKRGLYAGTQFSGRKNLENIQNDISVLAQRAVAETLQELECKNFRSPIKYKSKTLSIDFGLRDGLLESDIFSSAEPGMKQYYFTVKEMKHNSTTLYALSRDTKAKLFDGLSIQLLERF